MKNKMKKLFSKITILVLLVAMLIPYTSIPKVEAAEECPEGTTPEYHTNYYFFLQAEHPDTWLDYLAADKDDNGYNDNSTQTNYYTSFLYNFPSDGTKIIFEDEGFVRLKRSNNKASSTFNPATDDWTVQQFYMEYSKDSQASDFGNYKEYAFKSGNGKGTSSSDRVVSYLFHGNWAFLGNTETNDYNSRNENIINWDLNRDIKFSNNTLTIDEKYNVLANASILIDEDAASFKDVHIGAANIADGEIDFSMEHVKNAIETYNSLDSKLQHKQTSGNVKYISQIKNPVIEVVIGRKYELNDIFGNNVTNVAAKTVDAVKKYEVTYNGAPYIVETPNNNEEKKITIDLGETPTPISRQKSVIIKDKNGDYITWFLAPTLYQMSYKVCKDGGSDDGKVTLTYKGNEPEKSTEEAKNIPSEETKDEGSDFTIPETKPELSGYKFEEWNISPKCDSTEYEAGYTLEDLTNDTTLYACWASTDGTKGPGTGVLTYTGLFTGIIALAGGSYYIMKKKNLFRQI